MTVLDDALLLLPDVPTYDKARRELAALRHRGDMAEDILLEAKRAASDLQGKIDKALAELKSSK